MKPNQTSTGTSTPTKKRGFARLSQEVMRDIARKGNAKLRAEGKAHKFTSEEAQAAGRKGGKSRWVR